MKTVSLIFHIAAMITFFFIAVKDMDLEHFGIMLECIAIYFKVWDD